jgi:hypothetical protein
MSRERHCPGTTKSGGTAISLAPTHVTTIQFFYEGEGRGSSLELCEGLFLRLFIINANSAFYIPSMAFKYETNSHRTQITRFCDINTIVVVIMRDKNTYDHDLSWDSLLPTFHKFTNKSCRSKKMFEKTSAC